MANIHICNNKPNNKNLYSNAVAENYSIKKTMFKTLDVNFRSATSCFPHISVATMA